MPTCLRSRSAKVVRQWIVQKCFQPNSANTFNMQPAHSFSGGCEVFHGFIFRLCSFRIWKFNHFRSPPTRAMFRAFPMFDRKVDGWNSVLVIKTKQPDLATWTACLNVFTGLFLKLVCSNLPLSWVWFVSHMLVQGHNMSILEKITLIDLESRLIYELCQIHNGKGLGQEIAPPSKAE